MEKIRKFFDTKDKGKFWLHIVILAFAIWALTGIVSIFNPTGTLLIINEIIGGVAPCIILAGAVLSILERKLNRGEISGRQSGSEDAILFFFFVLIVFAQAVAVIKGTISYGVPLTLAGLAVEICIWFAGPGIVNHEKLESKAIMVIIGCGTAASIIIGKFISYLSETL